MKSSVLRAAFAVFAVVFGSFLLRSEATAAEPVVQENFLAVISSQSELRRYWEQHNAGIDFKGYKERVYDLNGRRSDIYMLGEGTRSSTEPLILILPKRSLKFEQLAVADTVVGPTEKINLLALGSDRGASLGAVSQSEKVVATGGEKERSVGALESTPESSLSAFSVQNDNELATSYVVRYGDSLLSIALRFDLALEEIAQLNNIAAPYPLTAGQRLSLPLGTYTKKQPKVQSKEKIETRSSGLSSPTVHIVKYGDTLSEIANRYDADFQGLAAINRISPPYDLAVGQSLILPATYWAENQEFMPVQHQPSATATRFSVQSVDSHQASQFQGESVTRNVEFFHTGSRHLPMFGGELGVYCVDSDFSAHDLQNIDRAIADLVDISIAPGSIKEVLPRLLNRLGYKKAVINFAGDGDRLHLSPGKAYSVRAIRLEPVGEHGLNVDFSPIEFLMDEGSTHLDRKDIELVAGDWFSSKGHFAAQIDSISEVLDHDAAKVDYLVRYRTEGPMRISSIAFAGEPLFTDSHLEKLLPSLVGTSARISDLSKLRERLVSTPYVSSVAFDLIDTETDAEADKLLLISAETNVSNRLAGSLYYDNVGQLGIAGEFLVPNLSRREDDLILRARWDDRIASIDVAYHQKNFFAYGNDLIFAVLAGQETHPYYDNDALGFSVESNWNTFMGIPLSLGVGYSTNREKALGDEKSIGRDFSNASLRLRGRTSFDEQAQLQWQTDLAVSYALSGLTQSFFELGGKASLQFYSSQMMGFDAHTGLTYRSFFDGSERAEMSQLYNGGTDGNRGYQYASATTAQWTDSNSIGKSYVQLEFPFLAKFSFGDVKFTPFIDLSMLSADDFETNESFVGVGIGAAFNVGSMPLRVDLATPLVGDDNSVALYFSLGAMQQ